MLGILLRDWRLRGIRVRMLGIIRGLLVRRVDGWLALRNSCLLGVCENLKLGK